VSSTDEAVREAVGGGEAYIVGGAVRDELLGRPVIDVDVACRQPEAAARAYRKLRGGTVFLLSERHGAWRVALRDGRTVDFTALRDGIEQDLAGRDFTVNAIAVPVGGGPPIDPYGGREDLEARLLRAVSEGIFRADPLRLLRAVRLEEELGLRLAPETVELVRRDAHLVSAPAGERIWAELERMGESGWRRLETLGLLAPLGGSTERLAALGDVPPAVAQVAVFGSALLALPIPRELQRFTRVLLSARPPRDGSPREIHRFRRQTEPWALEALAYVGRPDLAPAVERARAEEPKEPLLHGDELGVPPGPERRRILERIEEERAAGTVRTVEDARALLERLKAR
jgi:hypothetical protein